MQKIEIKTTDNGYIVSVRYKDHESQNCEMTYAVEEIAGDEQETVSKLLLKIASLLGFEYDKFSENNINISFDRKGHKLQDSI